MDKDLTLAANNPQEFLSKGQPNREYNMSIEDVARSLTYKPYETLLEKAEKEPKKYNWFSTIAKSFGKGAEMVSSVGGRTGASALIDVYSSPNMRKEQADRLMEDVAYTRYYINKADDTLNPIETNYPTWAKLSAGVGQFITQTALEMGNAWAGRISMYSLEQGMMEEQLAQKYVEETGGIEGYAKKKPEDDLLTFGYSVVSTAIERGLGMETLLGRWFRQGEMKGAREALTEALSPEKVVARQAIKQLGKKVGKGFITEGGEEVIQNYAGKGTEVLAGYATVDDLLSSEQLMSALSDGAVGGIIGAGAGFGLHFANRAKVKSIVNDWSKKHNLNLKDSQISQIANDLLDNTQSLLLSEITTRSELTHHYGQAFDVLVDKVKKQIEGTGVSLPEGQDLDDYARTVAKTIQIPAQHMSLWFSNIPLETYINSADLQVVNGMWVLQPMNNPQEVMALIDKQKAIIKEQNLLKKLGTENTGILDDATRRKNELEAIYNSLVEQETIKAVKTFRKKQRLDAVKAEALLPDQVRSMSDVVEAKDSESFVMFADKRVPVSYEVVELDSIQPSHINGEINPNYKTKELQNRASRGTQIDMADLRNKAQRFTPERVLDAPTSAEGAPVVNMDNEVIAGNGRAEIIRLVYEENPAGVEAYKKALESKGYNLTGFEKPVLIRKNTTLNVEQQIAAADISNISETSAFDAASQARQDSKYVVESTSIEDFASKIPMSERRGLMLNTGVWNKKLLRNRYEDALLSWLCNNDPKLFENLVLLTNLPRKVIDPIVDNGASIIELQKKYPDVNIREDIYRALVKYQTTNRSNFIAEMQKQEMDGRDVMPENVMLWHFIFKNSTEIGTFLNSYTQVAMANREAVKAGADMFGEKVAPLSKKDMYAQALKKADEIRAQTAAESGKKYEPLITETGEIKDINLLSAFMSYQDQFNTLPTEDTLFQEQFDLADENARLDDTYPEYTGETIKVDGKERTVYNSNGNRIAKSAEALRNFYKWFGNSKVVDEQGRPLVVYHGSKKNNLYVLDSSLGDSETYGSSVGGTYLTSNYSVAMTYMQKDAKAKKLKEIPEDNTVLLEYGTKYYEIDKKTGNFTGRAFRQAEYYGRKYELLEDTETPDLSWYKKPSELIVLDKNLNAIAGSRDYEFDSDNYLGMAKQLLGDLDSEETGKVYSVYLKIKKPLVVDFEGEQFNGDMYDGIENIIRAIKKKRLKGFDYSFEYELPIQALERYAQEHNYDGLIVKNVYDNADAKSLPSVENIGNDYVIFEPNQIKSVDNRGTYSSDTGNIYFQGKKAVRNAWYDPELQIIVLTKNWNKTSLVHEMHHHYLAKIIDLYNQAQAGVVQMTELGKAEIADLFSMLGIEDTMNMTQQQLKVAQEQFATMTEAYLTGLGVQENQNQIFKDFLNWIPEKYKSIANIGYLNAENKIVNPILDDNAIAFFNRWFGEAQMPALPASPDSQALVNPTDDRGEIIPSSQKTMNNREIKFGIDAAEQIDADEKLYASIDEDTPSNLRSAIDGANVVLHAEKVEDAVSMPDVERTRWYKPYAKNAQERMAQLAKDYVAKNPEHALELALADPEISTVYDAPVDRAWLIRAVMATVDQNSAEYAVMYDNLATYRSMSGSTLGLTNDMSQRAYLDAKREIESSREVKAAINYAGNGRGSFDKWTGDIKAFINARVGKIMATEAGSEERKVALNAFLEEAKTKFSGNTEDTILTQLDLTGVNTRSQAVFVKWAEKAIKQSAGVNLTNAEQKELMDISYKAQQAMLGIDNLDPAVASASARDLRNWQIAKDKMKKANFGKLDWLNTWFNNTMGGYVPSAMLMSFNTLFVANIPSTAINNAIVKSSAQKIYGKQAVKKSVLDAEEKRIRDIYRASGMNIAQMEKPTSPSLMHGEKYMGQDKSKWYDFTFKVLSWGDNLFRIPTFVDTLGRIASKNANGDAKLAEEKFKLYSQLNTKDEEAILARKEALAVANMAVFTQDGILSSNLNHIRSSINTISRGLLGLEKEGFGLGNLLAPFLKTGANVVEMGLTGSIAPVRQLAMWLKQLNGKEIPDLKKLAMRNDWKVFAWTAVSVALLSVLTGDDEELYIEPYEMGKRYDPNRPYDSINIAGVWVKLDTFGVFSTPIRVAVKLVQGKGVVGAYGFGLQEAIGETPLVNALTTDPTFMFKQPEKWAQGFAYTQANKLVPSQLKSLTRAGSRAFGIEAPDMFGDYIQRRFNRNYGLDGLEPTANDYINILTNRLKIIE